MRQSTNKFLKTLLAVIMCFGILHIPNVSVVNAAAGDVPDHEKKLTANPDGTFTIALNVKGDAEKKIQKVNVIVIVDRSGSMNTQSGTGAYVASNSTGANMYGYIDGEYVPLERRNSGSYYNPNYTFWYNNAQYTGQRYLYDSTATRLQATQAAVNGLASTLLGYNTVEGNPEDTVEMALVTFATAAQTPVSKTSSATTYVDAVNNISVATGNAAGTNWEAALKQANNVSFGDSDPTYVIFFSDGSPTFYGSTSGSGYEEEPNMKNSYDAAVDDAAALATKVGVDRFYTIFAYGTDVGADYMSDLTEAAGAPAGNNYSASNSVELEEAFAEILEAIEMAGIGNVGINDGTTSQVTTSTDSISHLLDVDTSSYKYYRAGGTENGSEKYDSNANGGLGEVWEDAPAATFENGAVKWNIDGVLENDVTYTVTFDCWPSQETLDYIADIKNDPDFYDSLDSEIKKYLDKDGNLKTNTTASISYVDTRTGESGSDNYTNPDPVSTSAVEQLAVSKAWDNDLDGQSAKPLDLTVTRDGENKYTVALSTANNWTQSVYISKGIMRVDSENKVTLLTTGHDFTFTEPADLGYYWELDVPVVRPMKINGTDTILIKVDAKHPAPEGATVYTLPEKDGVAGGQYYVSTTQTNGLTATNHRRARLNLTKVVDGEDADPAQRFPFTLNVVDSKASEGSADDTNTDYYVWFSIFDTNAGETVYDQVVSGATPEERTVDSSNTEHVSDFSYDSETGMVSYRWNGGDLTTYKVKSVSGTVYTCYTGYYYAPSGSDIKVEMKAGDNLRFLNLPSDSTYTFTEGTLPANYAFTKAELTAGEDSTFKKDGQTSTGTIESTNTEYTVTYTNTYEKSAIEITKVWEDADNQDNIRPTVEKFKEYLVLKADGTDVTTRYADNLTVEVDPDDPNKYIVKWDGLDRYANGEEIKYTVEESEIKEYTTTGSPAEDHGTITNTHTPEETSAIVIKVWEDAGNQDGKRPTSLEVKLYVGDEVVKKTNDAGEEVEVTAVLNANGSWTYTETGLPKYNKGELIEYTWKETTVPAGYTQAEGSPKAEKGADDVYTTTITNEYTPEKTTVTVTKEWKDSDDQDGKRPQSITVHLFAGEDEIDEQTITANDNWTYTWENLDKNAGGQPIIYTVTEDEVDEYTTVVGDLTGSADEGWEIEITNSHEIKKINVEVKKKWVDAENQDGKRPQNITVQLKANGNNVGNPVEISGSEWTYTWNNLDGYANGKPIAYTVEETAINGYRTTYGDPVGSAEEGWTLSITNTHDILKTSVKATKVWDDDNDRDGKREAAYTNAKVELYANGKLVADAAVGTVPAENGDVYTWTDLPVYEGGQAIVYTVVETLTGTDYTTSYSPASVTASEAELSGEIKITNSYTPELIEIEVEKIWEDNIDQDGIRPESVTINLLADDKQIQSHEVKKGEDDKWTYTFTGLNKYRDGGTEIVYKVTENTVANYNTKDNQPLIEGNAKDGFTVTNYHDPEQITVTVTKIWDDNNNQDGKRPESITVHLFADGVELTNKVATIAGETVDEKGNWTYTWTGLDKFKEGKAIVYTITEDEIDEYEEPEITGDYKEGFTITNTHEIEKINVTVEKKWVDNDNQDGYRPEKIVVHLLADGTELTDKKVEISEDKDGNWTYTWENLDKYADGKEITYTITEDKIDEYTPAITGDYKKGFVITNTHTPEEVTVTVTKEWNDANNQDGKRPDSLTVDLYADGKKVDGKTQQLKGEDWTYTWTGLPKKANGQDIKYTVKETLPDGYSQDEPVVTVAEDGTTTVKLKNNYTPEKTSVSVTKVWEDAGNQDGKRPASVTVNLLADGVKKESVELNEKNGWTYTWTGLDKKANGKDIAYTVTEEKVDGYKEPVITGTQAEGYTVTNSYEPETVDVPVTKEWDDADDQDGYRPEKITAILKADGEQIKTVELNESNGWTYTWEGLPKYKAVGKEIVYTVDEQPVDNYTKKIEGNKIINTHVTEETEVSVEKVWKDENNQDGVRPEKVTVKLLANGEKIDSVELSEENEWQYTWTKLDKKSGGKDIEYTVTEDAVDKYTTEITGSQKDGYVVTNTHVPDTIDIPVEKIWEDNNNNDKKRPESVTVYLKADGETVKTVELNEGNEWKYTWTGMAKYKAGVEIKYTVEEKTVANYDTPVIEGSVEKGFKITNPREDDKTSVPVEKKWEGDANLGVRPESIEVELLADDKETGKTITLNEGNNWKGTFEDLVVNKDGKKVIYTIKEVDVKPGYQSSVSGNAEAGFVITNKFTPKYVDPPVMKKVIGDSDGSGDKFTFQLKALKGAPMPDGVTGDTMTIEAGIGKAEFGFITIAKVGEYEYEISEVPDDGNENYKYDDTVYHLKFVVKEGENGELVDEAFVDGESVGTFEDLDAAQFTFVNEYREYIDIDVEKVWKDESTGPDKRPDSIIVELMADGETIITVELSDENEWKHTFEHLEVSRKTEEGEYVPIEYTVNEVKVEGYETSISGSAEEGFVITNTRTVDTGDASQLDFWRNLYITSTVGSLLVAALYFKKEEEK